MHPQVPFKSLVSTRYSTSGCICTYDANPKQANIRSQAQSTSHHTNPVAQDTQLSFFLFTTITSSSDNQVKHYHNPYEYSICVHQIFSLASSPSSFPPSQVRRHPSLTPLYHQLTNTTVWVKTGICSADSLINICLCLLGFLPGLLHAWYIIAKYPSDDYESLSQDAEAHRITYVVVDGSGRGPRRAPKNTSRNGSGGGYGTTAPMAPPVNQAANGTWNNNAAPAGPPPPGNAHAQGSSSGGEQIVPPSYAEAVRGDHKVQSQD